MKEIELENKSLPRDRILNAIGNGSHTLQEICKAVQMNNTEALREIEFLEDLELVKIPYPESPVTSWWLKSARPKGKIVRGDDGKLHVEKRAKKVKPVIPEPEPVKPLPVSDQTIESRYLPVSAIEPHPDNPRGAVNVFEQSFHDLVENIRANGVHQMLVVKKLSETRFRIIMGHRRFEAAKRAGLDKVPCVIREFENAKAEYDAMLAENIQRENLSPLHEAKAVAKRYNELGRNINALAFALNKPQGWLKPRVMIAEKLAPEIQELYDQRKIGLSNAVRLCKIDRPKQQKYVRQAMTMKHEEFKELMERETNNTKMSGTPAYIVPKQLRVTSDDEVFNRRTALKTLENAGETYIPATYFAKAFDDICLDVCDELACRNCPAPRLIEAVLRHQKRGEQNG